MISLHELQLLAEEEFSVETARKQLGQIADILREQPDYQEALEAAIVNMRKLSMGVAKEAGIFFVNEELLPHILPEELQHESLGFVKFNHFTFSGRIVFPVYDVRGNIMGFCGWDKFVQPKYLDSINHGYKAKRTTLYGMEKLPEYYNSKEPVFVVEGIVCCLYLRMKGFQALALLGSDITPYVLQILKRFGNRLVIIPDNDSIGEVGEKMASELAGEHLVQKVLRVLPYSIVVQSTVAKDIDDTRQADDGKYEQQLLAELATMSNPFMQKVILRTRATSYSKSKYK